MQFLLEVVFGSVSWGIEFLLSLSMYICVPTWESPNNIWNHWEFQPKAKRTVGNWDPTFLQVSTKQLAQQRTKLTLIHPSSLAERSLMNSSLIRHKNQSFQWNRNIFDITLLYAITEQHRDCNFRISAGPRSSPLQEMFLPFVLEVEDFLT